MILSQLLLTAVLTTGPTAIDESQGMAIKLWEHDAPGSEGVTEKERIQGDHVSNVHQPTITAFLPPKEKATGAAVVICPGGGHRFLAIHHEGYDVAKWFNEIGVAAFVLKYRLAQTPNHKYKVEVHSLQDAQRAIRLIRSRAKEWNVDPNRVGIMGFSAGGAVAALAATRSDSGKTDSSDAVEHQSGRPDFMILVYPGIRPVNDLTVTKDTPPAFFVHADDDRLSAERSISLYLALKKAGVPCEVHIYARGGHGFGIRKGDAPVAHWPDRLEEWMRDRGLLKK